ncbi:MAG: hypothetical protein ACYDHM_00930 [Acidiferrobacterales bacterium]
MQAASSEESFQTAFRGNFTSLLSWTQLDEFWAVVRQHAAAGWYLYAVGEPVPTQPGSVQQVLDFIREIDSLLRTEHREDYCGIVYTDSKTEPRLIKIFDPNNLGVSCGYSDNPPLPGWVMSLIAPQELRDRRPLPGNRRRWWQKLWA